MVVAFPYVSVRTETRDLQPTVQRAPGVIAIVGASDQGAAEVNVPREVGSSADAAGLFAAVDGNGVVTSETPLFRALRAALVQNPRPSKIYGVKLEGTDWAAGLAALNAADDVTFVTLANMPARAADGGGAANTELGLLRQHVIDNSADGQERMAVAAIDSAIPRGTESYADTVMAFAEPLQHTDGRMIMIAARGAVTGTGDNQQTAEVAAAAAAAIAGQPVATSLVLKRIAGFRLPLEQQFSPTEIRQLSENGINAIIDPVLIAGGGLHFADGRTFNEQGSTLQFIDLVRLLDAIKFDLKAKLVGLVGDARITKAGLNAVVNRAKGVLDTYVTTRAITRYGITVPVLEILGVPEAARSPGENDRIFQARSQRVVDLQISVTIGPALHLLIVTLAPRFT